MFAGIVGRLARRVVLAAMELPTARTWLAVAAIIALTAAACAAIGSRRGFLKAQQLALTPKHLLIYGLLPFVAPSLVEETVYRILLLPRADEHVSPLAQSGFVAASLFLFVIGHPLRFYIMPSKRNRTFTNPTFLIMATILGCGCTAAFLVSESLWPCILVHYLCVVGWLLFLGGAERLGGD